MRFGLSILSVIIASVAWSSTTNVVVAPLTKAMWNQGRHYNRMCPTTATGGCDGRMWAGCTAVATAIVLDYYKWPLHGTGDTREDEGYWSADTIWQRARFDQSYDWDAMQDVYGNITSARSSMAIATLMSDVGAVLGMVYDTSGSSTQFDKIQDVLGKHFFFDNSYAPTIKDFSADNQLRIQQQLQDGHPILCSGAANNEGTGHTYVCDGFAQVVEAGCATTNLYHFNFGWGGTNNGWYTLDSIFTSAKPGEAASAHPVDEMLLGVYPQKAPLFAQRPAITGSDLTVSWGIATRWAQDLTGLVLEHQTKQRITVNEEIAPNDWSMHKMNDDSCGWLVENGNVSAQIYRWGSWGTYWPGMGNCIGSTKPVSVSADTVITITYKAVKLPSNVSLKLTRCFYDIGTGEWDDHDAQWNLRTLATLPCGSSSSLESKTAVIKGSDIISGLGGDLTDVHFAINFDNPDYSGPTFSAGTEVFRLESFVISGEAEDWVTVEERALSTETRSADFTNLEEGDHRFVVTAQYADGEASRSSEQRISNTIKMPTVAAVETNANSVVFEISNASSFSYDFERQSNSLKGTPSVSGNRITYTFNTPVAQLGSHWLTLTVSNTVNGLVSKYVHVTNPPKDHPLCPYTKPTLESAVSRAKTENKLVFLCATGDPDGRNFMRLAEILSSNEVVNAVKDKYIVVEAVMSTAEGYNLARQYWRTQPTTSYGVRTAFQPLLTAYAVVINPHVATVPYACDDLSSTYYWNVSSRWNHFNSQYDLSNLTYDYYVKSATSGLVQFLGQDGFVVSLPSGPVPSVEGGDEAGTIVANGAGEYVFMPPSGGALAVSISDVGTNVIVVPPGVLYILGVPSAQIKVKHGTHDISPAFHLTPDTESGCVFLTLDENKTVVIGGETIPVRPALSPVGTDELATVPFAVGANVSVGVRTIPGLKYTLLRGKTPETLAEVSDLPGVIADGMRTQLKDENPPEEKAFYRVRVEIP